MIFEDFETMEANLMKEVVNRRQLGGYSADAATILALTENQLRLVQHLRDLLPRPKRK